MYGEVLLSLGSGPLCAGPGPGALPLDDTRLGWVELTAAQGGGGALGLPPALGFSGASSAASPHAPACLGGLCPGAQMQPLACYVVGEESLVEGFSEPGKF